MNYELVKKLKDAEFPFNPHRSWELSDFYWNPESGDERNEREKVWIPTLSELIQACGLPLELRCKNNAEKWYAYQMMKCGTGDTPEEAVANLWFALNKKENGDRPLNKNK